VSARVAVVDDERRVGQVLAMVLKRDGHDVVVFTDPRAFLKALPEDRIDLLITDLRMPHLDGVQVLTKAREIQPGLPVIVLTAHGTIDAAIAAMKQGAFDFVTKPFDNDHCRALVARALEVRQLKREVKQLRADSRARGGLDRIVAVSDGMQQVLDLARRAAASRATVLVEGESGTGKEVVARAIHLHSDRVGAPFVAVNCKAFSAGVLESELFGHDKGAFTGAARAREGVFERAHRGTLLLDEIGEVEANFQAKLLRVLQEREVLRVGGATPRAVDVRLVAATNRDLRSDVAAGRFREDLWYRLAVVVIRIPPLRERRDDVLPLARAFFARACAEQGRPLDGWTDEVEAWLLAHAWPGNVRELENCVERGVVLARGDVIELGDVAMPGARGAGREVGGTLQEHLDRAAAERIRQALAEAGGVKQDAARILGVERTTLYRLIKRYGIET